jgi:methylated-DNA-protein-cysteine methyltransferase-like protein
MLDFSQKVFTIVKNIPKGKVVSYGQVASMVGSPRSARAVGWALKTLDITNMAVPWWRVVNQKGYLSIKSNFTATKNLQKSLLETEGIKFSREYVLDIEKYRWSK